MHLGLNKTTQYYLRPQKFILDSLIFSKLKKTFFFLLLFFYSQLLNSKKVALSTILYDYLESYYPNHSFDNFIYIGIKRQKLYVFKNRKIVASYHVSTSKKGAGNTLNSFKTPTGLHKIHSKFGNNVPSGGIFEHREFTGKITTLNYDTIATGEDIICSRILRLEGLEKGFNKLEDVDSFKRKIYIHGTNEEGLIGIKASHGCIRMKNKDIIELFKICSTEMLVILLEN